MSIDTLITNAESRANFYANATYVWTDKLQQFIKDYDKTIIDNAVLNLEEFNIPDYVSPTKDATLTPVYEPPLSAMPSAPILAGAGAITMPAERTEPTLNTSGLFQQVMPTTSIQSFNEVAPDLRIEELEAEINSVATPALADLVFPEISAFSLGAAPTLSIPGFDRMSAPGTLSDPADYAARFEASYAQMAPQLQAWVDDKVSTWVTTYAPEYSAWVTQLQTAVTDGMTNAILPDQFEAAMYTRAQGRTKTEFNKIEANLLSTFAKSGFTEPPGAVTSAILTARMEGAGALANQSTDIYVERRKTEIQHKQFVMSLAAGQIQGVRNSAIAWAQVIGANMQMAIGYANTVAEKVEKVYDHLLARANLHIGILNAVSAQYEVQLKASLSALEGYKLQLQAEQQKTTIEVAKVQALESVAKVEELKIQRYSAIIDAATKKASIEELKLKGYSIRADIFNTQTRAQVAGFEMYRAALQGDQAKLEGELSKIKVLEAQIGMDTLKLDAQVKGTQATLAANEVNAKVFELGADVYKIGLDAALSKFTAQAEVKKLGQALYGQELNNAIDQYKVGLELPRIMMEAILKQYELKVQTNIETARIEIQKLQLGERATEAGVDSFKSMAAASLGSLNTMASTAISASA